MGLFQKGYFGGRKIEPASLKEGDGRENHGSRGWYCLLPVLLGTGVSEEWIRLSILPTENMVLVVFALTRYKNSPLDEVALQDIRCVLNYLKSCGIHMVVRFTYDREGQALLHEPDNIAQVTKHTRQVAEVIKEYKEDIFLLQGLMLGNWGEMHGSRYLSRVDMQMLYRIWEEETGGEIFLSVRKPVFLRSILSKEQWKYKKLGIFNDGILASFSDYGTYAEAVSEENPKALDWEETWSRKEELDFQKEVAYRVPVGGEAIWGDGYSEKLSAREILKELQDRNLTYLNKQYDEKLWNRLKQMPCPIRGVFQDRSLYEYIGAHLGYRYYVENAKLILPKAGRELQARMKLKNLGFAPMYERNVSFLEAYRGEQLLIRQSVELDLRKIPGGKEEKAECHMILPENAGDVEFYFCSKVLTAENREKEPVIYANAGDNPERVYLGRIRS